jgi:hypothetical protein
VSYRVRARQVRRAATSHPRRVRLGAAVLALVLIGSGATSVASSATPLAQFNRMTVSNTPSSSDPHLHTAIVQGGQGGPAYIASLRSQHPGIRILLYKTMWWLRPADPAGYASCLPGSGSYPANWYLRNSSGAPETWNTGTSLVQYAMDFGNGGYASACAQKLAADVKANGADGVFLDGAPTSLYWAQLPSTCTAGTCANNTNWQNGMVSALSTIEWTLHSHGYVVYANISGGNVQCCSGGPSVWQSYMNRIDGGMEESWTYGTNHLPVRSSQVINGILNVAWAEAHGKYMMVNDDITNCESCSDYGLATMLLAGNGHTTYDTANGIYRGSYGPWWPSYNTAQSLGAPTGGAHILNSGLWYRPFAGGWIVVNITSSAISDPTYGRVAANSAIIH